MEDFTRCFIFN